MKRYLLAYILFFVLTGCNNVKDVTDLPAKIRTLEQSIAADEQRIQVLEMALKKTNAGEWILWTYSWPNDAAFSLMPPTIPESAYPTKEDCKTAVDKKIIDANAVVVGSNPSKARFAEVTTTFYCFPSNFDPRRQK